MKKLIVMAAIAAASACSIADGRTPEALKGELLALKTRPDRLNVCKTITSNEWDSVVGFTLSVAQTNVASAQVIFRLFCEFSPVVSEYDERLAAAGIQAENVWTYWKCPKMHESAWADPTNSTYVARRRMSIASCRAEGKLRWHEWETPKIANFVMEYHRITFDEGTLDNVISKAMKSSSGRIKRVLRSKGRPITVLPDGTNPVQVEMDRLAAAFNSPRYAGVKEWMAEFYPEYQWIDSGWETDEEINKLKDDVYYGERAFSGNVKMTLRANLGVEAYNAFVKRYNNEAD